MTVIATAADERFSVSRVDVDRDGPTYTVDTLRDIRADLGEEHDYYFITGADALSEILSWREPEEVLRLARLVGVTRPGHVLVDPGLAPGPLRAAACGFRSKSATCSGMKSAVPI